MKKYSSYDYDKFKETGKVVNTSIYIRHRNVIKRVSVIRGYENVTVSENFKDFQYWADWAEKQVGFYNKSGGIFWAIDKDIVGDGTIYHEDVCVFVPPILNSFYTKQPDYKLPRGLKITATGNYQVRIKEFGIRITVGTYKDMNDAVMAYQDARVAYLFKLMDIYGDQVDERVFPALLLNLTNSFVVPDIRARKY